MKLRLDSALASDLCFSICRRLVLNRSDGSTGQTQDSFDEEAYQAWRAEELSTQFARYFHPRQIEGKDVVDFGCGTGDLAMHVTKYSPKSVLGLELDEEGVRLAKESAAKKNLPLTPQFRHSPSPDVIDLPDSSYDVIMCFDVLEHIMNFRAVFKEWKRVLRPGGRVLIWWSPWFHPYGPHIESLVPLPWAHAVFSDRILIETCARVYDMPDYEPRIWDLDDDGNRRPNKWRSMRQLPEVNQLTIAGFEDELRSAGLRVVERKLEGFGGSTLSRMTRPLSQLPVLREFFSAAVTYELGA